jgi:hypothetical protein
MHTFRDKFSILIYLTIVPGALFSIFLNFFIMLGVEVNVGLGL